MFSQPALFSDIPSRVFLAPDEDHIDHKTEREWRALGFKIAAEERPRPVGERCYTREKLYDFMQVDLMRKVPTRLYNLRLQWIENYPN